MILLYNILREKITSWPYLSRNPLWCPECNKHGPWIIDDFGKKITVEAHIYAAQTIKKYEDRILKDLLLEEIWDSGAMDMQYTEVIKALRENKSKAWVQASSHNPCRDYIAVWDRLGTLDEKDATLLTLDINRVVVPVQARKKILQVLHYSHQGITETYTTVRT